MENKHKGSIVNSQTGVFKLRNVGSGKEPEEIIRDAIGDTTIAQNLIDLANQEGANLDDVVTLLHGGVRVDLIEGWLQNGTDLPDAIAIINLGVNLNLIGTSDKVRNFIGLANASPNEVVSRIPDDARILRWIPDPQGIQEGMKFQWKEGGKTWNVRMHSPDPNPALPVGSNAASGWVLRVKRGSEYMDAVGIFYKDSIENPLSPNYNPTAINDTHIPIQAPRS